MFDIAEDNRLKYYLATVPESDRWTLSKLQASPKSKMPPEQQTSLIAKLQAKPDIGHAFLGPSGYGKSTWMYALFLEALDRHDDIDFDHAVVKMENRYQPVVFVHAAELLDQIEAWKYREGPHPILTVQRIDRMRQLGVKFSVFVDEFEKIRKSPFRMEQSYNLLEAMYRARDYCQLVIAGNLTKADLDDRNQYLEGTYRRIEALTTPRFWECGGK